MKTLQQFETRGNIELLSQKNLAVFASRTTPDEIFDSAEELFNKLLYKQLAVCSGWQAPLEKRLLKKFNAMQNANLVFYTAKDIAAVNLDNSLEKMEQAGKLLIISSCARGERASAATVNKRDRLILQQVKRLLFLFIQPGGRLEQYFKNYNTPGYSLYLLDHPLNQPFMMENIVAINSDSIPDDL